MNFYFLKILVRLPLKKGANKTVNGLHDARGRRVKQPCVRTLHKINKKQLDKNIPVIFK